MVELLSLPVVTSLLLRPAIQELILTLWLLLQLLQILLLLYIATMDLVPQSQLREEIRTIIGSMLMKIIGLEK